MTFVTDARFFSEAFPEVREAIYFELTKNFFVFQFPFMKKLLDAHAGIILNIAIRKGFTPAESQNDRATWQDNIVGLVGDYYYNMYPCEDARVAKVCFPEVYAFVRERFYKQNKNFFNGNFEDDIGVCVMFLMRINRTVYKARGWWNNPEKVAKVFSGWLE